MNLADHLSLGQRVGYRPPPLTVRNTENGEFANKVVAVIQRRESRKTPQPALVTAINANSSYAVNMIAGPVVVLHTDPFEPKGARSTSTEALDRARSFLTQGQLTEARQFLEDAVRDFPADESLRALAKIVSRNKATPLPIKFPRRDQDFRWLKANREQYKGKWVALLGGDLLAVGGSMKEVLSAIRAQQIQGAPLVHKVE